MQVPQNYELYESYQLLKQSHLERLAEASATFHIQNLGHDPNHVLHLYFQDEDRMMDHF